MTTGYASFSTLLFFFVVVCFFLSHSTNIPHTTNENANANANTNTNINTRARHRQKRRKEKKSLPDKLSRRRVVFSTDFHLWRKTLIQVFFFTFRLGFSCSMQRLNPHDVFSPWSNFFCNDSQPLFLNFVALEHRANWTVDSDKSGKLHSCRKIYLK